MFGYVTIAKDELKIKEYNQFRAYYCGLCRSIGRNGNGVCRLGLTYDMAFLALLLSGVLDEPVEIYQGRCLLHPAMRRMFVRENRILQYCADLNTMLAYLKFQDDVKDDHSVKGFFARIPFSFGARRAKRRWSTLYHTLEAYLNRLSELEQSRCGEIDRVADCFAHLMEAALTPPFVTGANDRKILGWLGYNLGRWVYVLDALSDYKKDEEKGGYNPFVISGRPDVEQIQTTLTFTLDNVAKSYELLEVSRNDSILRNILYFGLIGRQDAVLKAFEKQEDINGSI